MLHKKPWYVEYLLIIIGAFIMGFAIKNIYDPVSLVTGGVSGIAIIVKEKMIYPHANSFNPEKLNRIYIAAKPRGINA